MLKLQKCLKSELFNQVLYNLDSTSLKRSNSSVVNSASIKAFKCFYRWQSLHALKEKKEEALSVMKALYDFHQSCDETQAWINEKDQVLSNDDVGRDLAGVHKLQRRHQVRLTHQLLQ